MKKPNPKFFEKLLEDREINFNECLFVDDRKDLIDAAKKLGMKVIMYKNLGDFKRKLLELNIN